MAPAEKWQMVQTIFLAAADLPLALRPAALDEMCRGDRELRAEVESLLQSDSPDEGVLDSAIETEAASLLDGRNIAGSHVGPYRIVREIGRGGMGAVYLAVRDDQQYESEVAIKLVRPGFDTDFILRRFRRERQILARLQHPNIARLLDGGATEDDIPYIVMEYIDGAWITHYVRDRQPGLEDTLRLFLPVCAAVEYVHRAFIVHRDLKPGNILVDRTGTPKLLDFGISKLLRCGPRDPSDTQAISLATPDYASPEQVLGDPVTVATDVYSLGVVLYELLTGRKPHRLEDGSPRAVERVICNEPIPPPSQAVRENRALARRLAGNLDAIILRAIERDPSRRYESVGHLAEDLRRHLNREPVLARQDQIGRRSRQGESNRGEALAVAGIVAAAAVARMGIRCLFRGSDASTGLKRELLAAYSLVGSLADSTLALHAYTAMSAIAKEFWSSSPSDVRAQVDYGTAQLGLASALPSDRSTARASCFGRACALLRKARRICPHSAPGQVNLARAWHWAACVYLTLARREKREHGAQDEGQARICFERALAEWRKLEQTPEYDPQAFQSATDALAGLTGRSIAR